MLWLWASTIRWLRDDWRKGGRRRIFVILVIGGLILGAVSGVTGGSGSRNGLAVAANVYMQAHIGSPAGFIDIQPSSSGGYEANFALTYDGSPYRCQFHLDVHGDAPAGAPMRCDRQ